MLLAALSLSGNVAEVLNVAIWLLSETSSIRPTTLFPIKDAFAGASASAKA